MESARTKRLEGQEEKDKKNLLYLLKSDLLKTYQKNEVKKALVLREQRQKTKTFLVLMKMVQILKHCKRCVVHRKE